MTSWTKRWLCFLGSSLGLVLLVLSSCQAQEEAPADRPPVNDPEFDQRLQALLSFSVPLIGPQELQEIQDEVFIFDTRMPEEYQHSRLKGAVYLGYENPQYEVLDSTPRDAAVILYCSVGYRSEAIGKNLQDRGFSDVRNLYGGIFAWVNQGYPVVDSLGQPTQTVHTYNAEWSRWLNAPGIDKVW